MIAKNVTIGGKDVLLAASGRTPLVYRQLFPEHDIIRDFQKIKNDDETINVEALERIAFCMAKQADPNMSMSFDEWLDQFGMFDLYQAFPEIVKIWALNGKTQSIPKKK